MAGMNDPELQWRIYDFHKALVLLEQALRKALPDIVDQPPLRIVRTESSESDGKPKGQKKA